MLRPERDPGRIVLERLLRTALFGHVARHLGGTDETSRGVDDGRDRDRHRDGPAVLVHANGVAALDAPLRQVREDGGPSAEQ